MMFKKLSILTILVVLALMGSVPAVAARDHTLAPSNFMLSGNSDFAGGSGTEDDPWQIATADQLNNVRNYLIGPGETDTPRSHFVLVNDIDLSSYGQDFDGGKGWQPIGSYTDDQDFEIFNGKFDGAGHTISNLFINRPNEDKIGLFGFINIKTGDGSQPKPFIFRVNLLNVDVTGRDQVGGLIGYAEFTAIYQNHVSGDVKGRNDVGGLLGFGRFTYVQYNNSSSADILATYAAGGLVGNAIDSVIAFSYATGDVNASNNVGGLIGNINLTPIRDSFATGNVTGRNCVGGLVGYHAEHSIQRTFAIGTITGESNTGGLVGCIHMDIAVGPARVYHSYYNHETSGQIDDEDKGEPRTTEEMTYPHADNTYRNWDFRYSWDIQPGINDGYPFLKPSGYYTVHYLHGYGTTFTVPEGVTEIVVEAWGGGGGSIRPPSNNTSMGGGGGGAYSIATIEVKPGERYTYEVGSLGSPYDGGSDGGDTYWKNEKGDILVLAKGGTTATTIAGAPGGDAAEGIGDDTYSGGRGASGLQTGPSPARYGGGGGGAAGPDGDGGNAIGWLGGVAGGYISGSGGNGSIGPGIGERGNFRGGGAGGSSRATTGVGGQSGASGVIRIGYVVGDVDEEPQEATVTLSNLFHTYDGSAKAATVTTDPVGLNVIVTYDGSTIPPTNAGEYNVVATVNEENYVGSAEATLTIQKATPFITWSDPVDITYGTPLSNTQLNATASVEGSFDYTPSAGTVLEIGDNQPLSVLFTPIDTNNYNTASKTVSINVNPLTITVTPIDDQSKIYGEDDPVLLYDHQPGLVDSDEFSGTLSRDPGEDIGNYEITQGDLSLSSNYTLIFVTGVEFEITKRPIEVTADNQSKIYGDINPDLTYTITTGSLAENADLDINDKIVGDLTRESGEDVGKYDITQGTLTIVDNAENCNMHNYDFSFIVGELNITTRPITITADDKLKVEGSDDPILTWEISDGSLAFNDEIVGELKREIGENPGTYTILQGTLNIEDGVGNNVLENYILTFVPGTFTIIPQGALTTGSFEYFDMNEVDGRQQFRLIYTPDYQAASDGSIYRLAASNPGQLRYNAFIDATGIDELTLRIPFPFVTQGAMPIHVYDADQAIYNFDNGFSFMPGVALDSQSEQISLADYDPQVLGSTLEISVNISGIEGLAIVSIHLDYGPKRTTGWAQKQVIDEDKNPIAYEYCSETGGALQGGLELVNNQDYHFIHTLIGNDFGNVTGYSINEFKRNAGIGGLVIDINDNPLETAEIKIYQTTTGTGKPGSFSEPELRATVYTDEDGWYLWAYKWRGRPTSFIVELWHGGQLITKSDEVSLSAMGYYQVDFYGVVLD